MAALARKIVDEMDYRIEADGLIANAMMPLPTEKAAFEGPEELYRHAGHAIKSAVAALEDEVPGYQFMVLAIGPEAWRFDHSKSLAPKHMGHICTTIAGRAFLVP